jgi:hypothetical protein
MLLSYKTSWGEPKNFAPLDAEENETRPDQTRHDSTRQDTTRQDEIFLNESLKTFEKKSELPKVNEPFFNLTQSIKQFLKETKK